MIGRALGGLILSLALPAAGSASETFVPYRDARPDGVYIDWLDGHVGASARVMPPRSLSERIYLQRARHEAEEAARPKLLAILKRLPIDSSRYLGDDAAVFGDVRKLVERTTAASLERRGPTMVRGLLKLPLHGTGGLTEILFPQEARAAEEAPADPPSGHDGVTGPAAASPPTGLILDATSLQGVRPALLPRVIDESGRVVYGPEVVDPAATRARGLAGYALVVYAGKEARGRNPRQGANPIRVRALSAAGAVGTDLVISDSDAEMILREAAAAPFLKEGRVLVLMPATSAPPDPAPAPPARKPSRARPPVRENLR